MTEINDRMIAAELVELGRIEIRRKRKPVPRDNELLIKTRAVGLCGTDLKAFSRGHPFFTPPCVLGHEVCGEVVALGRDVRRFALGDRVAVAPYVECGTCDLCRRGLGELCRSKTATGGALQEYIIVPKRIIDQGTYRLDNAVSDEVATLAEPLACVLNGLRRTGVSGGDRLLIIGGGPMGVLTSLAAGIHGADVLISERSASRINLLQQLGLNVMNAGTADPAETMTSRWGVPQADHVIAAVGIRQAVEGVESWVAPGGSVLWFGGLPRDARISVDPYEVHYREVSIVGSFGFSAGHFSAAVRLVDEHHDELAKMITHSLHVSEIDRAFQLASAADGLKIVITFGERDA